MPLKVSKNFKHDSRHLQNTSLDFGTYPTKKYEGVNQASTGRDREDVQGRGLPEPRIGPRRQRPNLSFS